jgi:uncharacterized protein YfaT (DUF1175 family)
MKTIYLAPLAARGALGHLTQQIIKARPGEIVFYHPGDWNHVREIVALTIPEPVGVGESDGGECD